MIRKNQLRGREGEQAGGVRCTSPAYYGGIEVDQPGCPQTTAYSTTSKFPVPEAKKKLYEIEFVSSQCQRTLIPSLKLSQE